MFNQSRHQCRYTLLSCIHKSEKETWCTKINFSHYHQSLSSGLCQITVSAEKRCWTWWTWVSQPQGEHVLEVKQIKVFLLTRIKGDTGMSVLRMLSWEEFKVSLWHILNTVQGNVQLHCNLVSLSEETISPHSDIFHKEEWQTQKAKVCMISLVNSL